MKEPMQAETVIVGGGAIGCGVAYSLAQAGQGNVVVLEKGPALAAATSAQAAGLVGQVRDSLERTRLAMWSVRTFSHLQKQEETNPSWRQVGSMRVALTEERVQEFRKLKEVADQAGLETEFMDAKKAQSHWPLMNFSSARAILWCPTDGYLQPYDLTMAYQEQARQKGARFLTNTRMKKILQREGSICGVETDRGEIRCSRVINAAGAHAYHVAKMAGLELPIVPVRHEYLVTVPCPGLTPDMPVIRIPDATLYMRAEVNAVLLGGWEPCSVSCSPAGYKAQDDPPGIEPDWEVLAGFAEQLAPLFPQMPDLGIRSVFKGWPTFTPDGRFIIGPTRRLTGFVMAGGCNAHGVSGSAGIGRHVVESVLEANPSPYVRNLSPDRFLDHSWDWETAQTQARKVYESYYGLK